MKLLKLVPDDTNIKFLKWRIPFYVVSTLLIIASWGLVFTNGLNLGVDFVGGQQIQVTFTESEQAPIAELREEVASLGYGEPVIQRFGADNGVSIRFRLPPEVEEDAAAADAMTSRVTGAITDNFADARIDDLSAVSGKVSGELFETAMFALAIAMIAIAIYIWVRFEWQFGVGALYALVHDVSLTLGMFALFQLEFDLKIIAAILTIIGFSLNDTIVLFDRIREELTLRPTAKLREVINLAINAVLTRSVLTSFTTLLASVSLMLFGKGVINDIAFTFTIGIITGTFSSIFIASPVFYFWHKGDRRSVESSHDIVPEYDWQVSTKAASSGSGRSE